MKLIFCFIIGFIGGFFFSTALSVTDHWNGYDFGEEDDDA